MMRIIRQKNPFGQCDWSASCRSESSIVLRLLVGGPGTLLRQSERVADQVLRGEVAHERTDELDKELRTDKRSAFAYVGL
jgi:hypothetical protein